MIVSLATSFKTEKWHSHECKFDEFGKKMPNLSLARQVANKQ